MSGLIPGLEAGATMLLVLAIVSAGRGHETLEPLQWLLGGAAAGRGDRVASTLMGLLIHLLASALLGAFFAHQVGRVGRVSQLGLGLLFGLLLWAGSQLVLLPLLGSPHALKPATLWGSALGHVAYGLMLGAALPTAGDIDEHRP